MNFMEVKSVDIKVELKLSLTQAPRHEGVFCSLYFETIWEKEHWLRLEPREALSAADRPIPPLWQHHSPSFILVTCNHSFVPIHSFTLSLSLHSLIKESDMPLLISMSWMPTRHRRKLVNFSICVMFACFVKIPTFIFIEWDRNDAAWNHGNSVATALHALILGSTDSGNTSLCRQLSL
jgi:hypothetical protein